jgi:hypothetical protein
MTNAEPHKPNANRRPLAINWQDREVDYGYYPFAGGISRKPPIGWTSWDDHVVRWYEAYRK